MASTRKNPDAPKTARRPAARTPEARENQLIDLAYDAVEKKIRAGEASSQELTHFLKLGSTRERLEQERMMREVELLEKKAETMNSMKRMEELYEGAINAMRSYGGNNPDVPLES